MTIPVWNPDTLLYELPPTQYYGFPFPIESIPFFVVWVGLGVLLYYVINDLSSPLTFILATLCQGLVFSIGLFFICWWDFQNTIWNCVPQIDPLSVFGFSFAVSIILHYAMWGSYYFITKRMKKEAAE